MRARIKGSKVSHPVIMVGVDSDTINNVVWFRLNDVDLIQEEGDPKMIKEKPKINYNTVNHKIERIRRAGYLFKEYSHGVIKAEKEGCVYFGLCTDVHYAIYKAPLGHFTQHRLIKKLKKDGFNIEIFRKPNFRAGKGEKVYIGSVRFIHKKIFGY